MPTIYVSNSTANGYAVGNDSNTYTQMQSKSTPALTLTGALSKSVAGDTIVINDGTYNESSFLTINKANLTINPQTTGMAIIRAATGTIRVIHQATAGTGLIIGPIVLDANAAQTYCISQDSAADVTDLTINGTQLINFTSVGFFTQFAINVTMYGNWLIRSSSLNQSTGYGLNITTKGGTISITNGVIDLDAGIANMTTMGGIKAVSNATGATLTAFGLTINCGKVNSPSEIYCMEVSAFVSRDIHDNTLTTQLVRTTGAFVGIKAVNSQFASTKCWVYKNSVDGGNPNTITAITGIGIQVGDDLDTAPTNTNTIQGIWVNKNTVKQVNHGILLGWVNNGTVQGNYAENVTIGVIGKHTQNCYFSGNVIVNVASGGGLRMKGSGGGDIFTNNTVILRNANGIGIYVTDASTGGKAMNNIIYLDNIAATCVKVLDTSIATFAKNDYFSKNGSFASPAFSYQASNYNAVADWKAAQETSALNVDPSFVSYPTDLRVPAGTTLYHAGDYVGAQNADYRLSPFYVTPTIGAYEVGSRDPVLNRTPARIGP